MGRENATERPPIAARVDTTGSGRANVATGLPVLDHLLCLLAEYARFDLALEIAAGGAVAEVASAGRVLGESLADELRREGAAGFGSVTLPADEALAHVSLEASGRPLLVSNVDLSQARLGGVEGDVVARFLRELVDGAGLTLHLRLLEGKDTQHVLDAIFKALGVALAQACGPRGGD
jgi:imidazoleglycerol-phosphate dehydratase